MLPFALEKQLPEYNDEEFPKTIKNIINNQKGVNNLTLVELGYVELWEWVCEQEKELEKITRKNKIHNRGMTTYAPKRKLY